MLKWRKSDLQSELENPDKQELYVLYIRDSRTYENYQHSSFKGRVQLKNPEMKDGDLSVILKNVTMNDTGIYECYAGYGNEDPQLINSTNLKVVESGPTEGQSGNGGNKDEVKKDGGDKSGSVGLIVGLSVLTVLVVAAVGFMIYRKRRTQSDPDYQPPAGQDLEMS